jgi:hypothetical protein
MVLLEIVTARTEAKTPIHVMNETILQPSLGADVGVGTAEVIMVTVHPSLCGGTARGRRVGRH